MKLKMAALAAALVVSAAPALAVPTVVDWGVHSSTTQVDSAFFGTGASFDRILRFSLGSVFDALVVAVANDFVPILDLTGSKVELFKNLGGLGNYTDDGIALASISFDSTPVGSTFTSLSAGDYYYRITGMSTGTVGGSYVLSSTVTPVPEPASIALLLAGLGVLGFAVRRRKAG